MEALRWFLLTAACMAVLGMVGVAYDIRSAPSPEARLVAEDGTCGLAGRALVPCKKYFFVELDGSKKFSHNEPVPR